MFTKEDFFISEVYSPPAGEKVILIFPGSKNYYDADKTLRLRADKITSFNDNITWKISINFIQLFKTDSPMSINKVVRFFNEGKERHLTYRILIKELFRNSDV